ncbi:MAG TPA: hypothetical protein VKZ60_17140 [Chloroflexota bacterium]|nr:hypothetical protein [Chloroflexota bacterium]
MTDPLAAPAGAAVALDAPAPRLLPGVRLTELDSGASQQMYLLRLPNGRHFQLAGPLYHLVSLLDGQRTPAAIAVELGARLGRPITAEEVATIIDRKLAPLGILATADAPERPPAPTVDSALGVVARLPVVPARVLEPVAEALKWLYAPPVALGLVLAIVLAHVYSYQQLAPLLATLSPINFPLVAVLAAMVCVQLVLPWHELGHAAAARYFGARHGPMSIGLLGPMLAAMVEVTDVWHLTRRQRLVVDLGGVYFQSMSVLVLAAMAAATGSALPLWVVLAMDVSMLMNLNPLFKLDGYWAVSDATGITNLHQRVGQQLSTLTASALLRLGRLLRIAALAEHPVLHFLAAQENQLRAYGASARVALALFATLFVLSLLYFLLLTFVLLPALVLSYPLLAVAAWNSARALLEGIGEPTTHILLLVQFGFATLLLIGLAGMAVRLVRAWRVRGTSRSGFGAWPGDLGGFHGAGWRGTGG